MFDPKSTIAMTKLFQFPPMLAMVSLFIAFSACQPATPEANVHVSCAEAVHVHFAPGENADSLAAEDGWTRWDNGRLMTRKVAVPSYRIRPTITAAITLKSAGDPWDKSGSLVLFPNTPETLIDRGFQVDSIHAFPGTHIEQSGTSTGYAPPLELLRFITPFGVGHFSHMERLDEYRPVYIPRWEDSVHWEADISHLWESLGDTMHLGLYIDTWTPEGYTVDVNFRFTANPETVEPEARLSAISLCNTTKFGSEQRHFDAFSTQPLVVPFSLPTAAKNAQLHYTVTGHGGHSTGDEFVPCEHQLTWNGDSVLTFTPWRDDCASFRRFNPSSGVWMERTFWRGDSLDERLASSDLSRTGWCPGSHVEPVIIPLGHLAAGEHTLGIEVPKAQPFSDEAMNFWNVAAYVTYELP